MNKVDFEYYVKCGFYECDENIEIEALYQAFKARLINEIYGTSKDIQDVVIMHDRDAQS